MAFARRSRHAAAENKDRMNPFHLLAKARLGPLFLTQFLGAFNDNLYKNALVILIAYQASALSVQSSHLLINLSAGLFILPFFLFSATAGQLADQMDKATLIRRIKALEILIMLIGAAGLVSGKLWVLMPVLFLMGTQSSFFGPVKYAILPQHLPSTELVEGNGLVAMGTFLAILLGTLAGGLLVAMGESGRWIIAMVVLCVALGGWCTSRAIPPAEPATARQPLRLNLWREIHQTLGQSSANQGVFTAILGISWFWFFGALLLTQIPNFTRLHLGGNETIVVLLLTTFSLGIGGGALLAARLSMGRVEPGLVPMGALGMSLFGLDLGLATPTAMAEGTLLGFSIFLSQPAYWRVLLDLGLLSLSGGLYIVPLYAMVQSRTAAPHRARVIAGNNILNALYMVLSALFAIVLLGLGVEIPRLFITLALMNVLYAGLLFSHTPEFLISLRQWWKEGLP